MQDSLRILSDGALDFVALGSACPSPGSGIVPFRKANECRIHVKRRRIQC